MKFLKRSSLVTLASLLSGFVLLAQFPKIPETRNAALRYWMAFADLQDLPADKEMQQILEKTAAGELPYDEAKLGSILDKNEDAILAMQRATKLPDCDWGLEYSLGPRASIAPVVKARVLARLNTLYGMRLAAKGDADRAVETWLAGLRFSRDMAKGGSLIFALIAKTSLVANLNAIKIATDSGKLSPQARQHVAASLSAIPDTGFDWRSAWLVDAASTLIALKSVMASKDPNAEHQRLFGEPLPALIEVPIPEYQDYITQVGDALRLPPGVADNRLVGLEQNWRHSDRWYSRVTPSPFRVNGARKEVAKARDGALQSLAGK